MSTIRLHLGVEHFARQAVLRDAKAHHAAGIGPASRTVTSWPSRAQVVCRRQPRGSGADDQHPLAVSVGGWRRTSSPLDGLVAEEALDRVDADRLVELGPVAGGSQVW
jgi:hypothetical protein